MTNKIELPFVVGEKSVTHVAVDVINFNTLCAFITLATAMAKPESFDARLKRVRFIRQVKYFSGETTPIELGVEDVMKMPIPAARKISGLFDEGEGLMGEIIRDGDGVSTPILYKLGTPIPVAQGKPPIVELEFFASTYGELEEVLAAGDTLHQAAMLIKTVAKPVHGTLQTLPSWASDKITIADGVTLARNVLPRFLGEGEPTN